MKKQIIAGMISAAMALTLLAGCGSSSSGSAAPAAGAGEAKSENKYEMAYVLSTRDEFLGLLEDNVAAAAEELGVGMEMKYAGEDSQKMIDCISAAKTEGKDAVLVNLNAAEDAQACIEAAGDMKVVFINRVPADYGVLSDSAAVHTRVNSLPSILRIRARQKSPMCFFGVLKALFTQNCVQTRRLKPWKLQESS